MSYNPEERMLHHCMSGKKILSSGVWEKNSRPLRNKMILDFVTNLASLAFPNGLPTIKILSRPQLQIFCLYQIKWILRVVSHRFGSYQLSTPNVYSVLE